MFNNSMFVIVVVAMAGKKVSGPIKSTFEADDNHNAKPAEGIAMTGLIVIASLLLSGLSLMGNHPQSVVAQQQNTTEGGVNATGTVPAGNQSEVRSQIEEALTALQNNDTQTALMHLDLALNALGSSGGTTGNNITAGTTSSTIASTGDVDESDTDANRVERDGGGGEEDSECGGITVGGTSAADDYGCPPDPDG
jgi:hypothetical protein